MPTAASLDARRFGLRTYLILLSLMLLLPALGLGGAVAWHAVGAYRNAFDERLQETARALALALDGEIGIIEATLNGLAATRLLDEDATPADLADFHARAREIAEPLRSWVLVSGPGPDFETQIHTLVPPGTPLGAGLGTTGLNPPRPRAFATGRLAVGDITTSRVSGHTVSFVFVPVIRDGRIIRAVGMALHPARLARLVQAQNLSGGAFAVVTDTEGQIVARSFDHEQFVDRPAPGWYGAAIAGRQDSLFRGLNIEGSEVVLGFARLAAAPGWTIAVVEPWAAYAASWQNPLAALAVGGALILALGLAMALSLARRLVRPIAALARDAQAFALTRTGDDLPLPSAPASHVIEFEALRHGLAAANAALCVRAAAKRKADERRTLLMREVDHRAKNALAVALSLVRLAPRDVPPAQFAAAVEGRIAAMARAHALLAKEAWSGADFRAVAEAELAAYAGQVELAGPPARLAAEAVQPVGMLLHEVATNAAKHGALSTAAGRVSLTWEFTAVDGGLQLSWTEFSGPAVSGAPQRRGFGSRLVVQLAERQLGGRIAFRWLPAGLSIALALPPGRTAPPIGVPRSEVAAGTGSGAGTMALLAPPSPRPGQAAGVAEIAASARRAAGRSRPRVLVVEDEAVISLELEVALHELGCEVVGPARNLTEALRLAKAEPDLHAAVLDVNLGDSERSFPVADRLEMRGVPYVFATGYTSEALGGRDARAVAVLRKPYSQEALAEAIGRAMRNQPGRQVAARMAAE